ncbi:MAG: hypothetical protein O7C67_02005 [Gammaproteobacteria bacterium]|nr:hypothetical protein [Gammaproteobacteria bacterium]
MDLLPFFEWLDTSILADIAKAYGGVFVVVQTFHLLALSLLGGTVLVGDLRLLGVVMKDVPSQVVIQNTQKWFSVALVILILSGLFQAAAVAMKLYYNEMFWAKMTGLAAGIVFVYAIRRPLLLRFDHDTINPWALRLIAVSSMTIWFTVAASGRWIGFS